MTNKPFMPKATAVWLVENTKISFKQIAAFCDLHELEVKGIADGDVAKGIKAYNPILAGQLTRDEIEASSKDIDRPLVLNKKILEKKFESLGVVDNNVVFSCGSSVTASVLGVAYSLINNKYMPTIYIGSWSEYGKK